MESRHVRGLWLAVKTASLVFMVAVLAGGGEGAPADPTKGDANAELIEFPIPGSSDGVVSRAIVVLPSGYRASESDSRRYPVIYLLHGYSGDCTDWYTKSKDAHRPVSVLADRHDVIVVMPDGKQSSWYLNAVEGQPDAADWQWETVMTSHLVQAVDSRYRTWAEPGGRGITGLSMGGHGALYLAARHPELFGACSSMSGVMNLENTTQQYDLGKRLGSADEHRERFVEHSVLTQAKRFAGRKVGILLDCGRSDRFYADHQALREKLLALGVEHDYIERPGGHTWPYWINALPYHVQFMADRLRPAGADTSERKGP